MFVFWGNNAPLLLDSIYPSFLSHYMVLMGLPRVPHYLVTPCFPSHRLVRIPWAFLTETGRGNHSSVKDVSVFFEGSWTALRERDVYYLKSWCLGCVTVWFQLFLMPICIPFLAVV